jgi:uncharacterized protein involved in response to NO
MRMAASPVATIVLPRQRPRALVAAALAWTAAFAIYLFIHTPWLVRTRLDGKDG